MKKHNALKVVLITILVFLLLTWILPAAYYSGEYVEQGRIQMGLFDLFNYPLTAFAYFGYIALFLIAVGGFYGILYKVPAYRLFLESAVRVMNKNKEVSLSLIIIVMALLVSICGLHIGIALFIPLVISLIFLMGYDKIVAGLVVVGSISAGLIGSTYSYNNIGVLTQLMSLDWNYKILARFIILAVSIVVVIFNVLMYIKANKFKVASPKTNKDFKEETKEIKAEVKKADVETKKVTKTSSKTKAATSSKSAAKTKKSSSKSSGRKNNKAALKGEDVIVVKELNDDEEYLVPATAVKKNKVWPVVVMFVLLFILTVLAFVNWGDTGFGIKLFSDLTDKVQGFELFKFPLFSKILGNFNAFGSWTITDLFLPMAIFILVLAFIYRVKFDDVMDGFVSGVKTAMLPAALVVLVYTVLVLVTYHPFQLVIYKFVLDMAKGFNIFTTVLVAMFATLFNVDILYTFQSAVPYYTSYVANADSFPLAAIIFQSMYGLITIVAPTSLVLLATIAYLKISYKEWLQSVWKLVLELFAVLLFIFIIISII